ncbi:MAG TPA: prepilin-type N-terminal cleavage/methylation domain-containing protein [Polyangiales bacterium]|nr:prepilin-type N-terminal cleavage/methylation domain-containing protein [Polyangiales bacterium]
MRQRARRRSSEGVTIIEMMVVVVIIAIGASAASYGLGALSKTSLQSACVRIASLSRYAYHRALTQSTTVRVTFDLDNDTYAVSEAHGRVTLVRSDAKMREDADRAAEEDKDRNPEDRAPVDDGSGAGIDPWEAAKQKVEKPDVLTLPPSPFSPISSASGKPVERFKTQPIGDGVGIAKLIVAHEAKPKVEGKVDLFYFSNGQTQHAVVQLHDRDNIIYSVEIHPLTGRGTIRNTPYEPETLMDDPTKRNEDATEVEDRGS